MGEGGEGAGAGGVGGEGDRAGVEVDGDVIVGGLPEVQGRVLEAG